MDAMDENLLTRLGFLDIRDDCCLSNSAEMSSLAGSTLSQLP